jgi:hypothetical protein
MKTQNKILRICLSIIIFFVGYNTCLGQETKKIMVKGEAYSVTPFAIYKNSNRISTTNFYNKVRFTASPNQNIIEIAKCIFQKERLYKLKETKDAILISFYLDSKGYIKEISFNVSHAPNIKIDELKILEDYLMNNYNFNLTTQEESSTYLVCVPLWFERI